ncbi:chemotaxis protein CheA [Pusillimonas minor]|uniref:Chemotaxis protein CheA n=1 Tax=Pusillimonas minor TaxID=2697024 RepID=A0A842HJP3_9BURK|nr:chemotaxis protein CheA [Pusillimonas minor]MBC2768527.1 chemotaxis protein CheA [Pusillimonas minor]
MSEGVDLSQFYDMFFDEADELLADMEQTLLQLDIGQPDMDQLNAIFRAAHSIKGGAGTFGCFGQLAETTHLLENLLDALRQGEMTLRKDMVDLFLETKDVLSDQVAAYRNGEQPDAEAYERICEQLRQLALQEGGKVPASPAGGMATSASQPQVVATPAADSAKPAAPAVAVPAESAPIATNGASADLPLHVSLINLNEKDAEVLQAEMMLMGDILHQVKGDQTLDLWIKTTESAADIEAVCCFVVDSKQVKVAAQAVPGQADTSAPAAQVESPVVPAAHAAPAPSVAAAQATPAIQSPEQVNTAAAPDAASAQPSAAAASAPSPAKDRDAGKAANKEAGTLRVGVEKVDQIINLVGELVITQAMLVQTASTLDPVLHDRLLNGIEHLERNARDLQEAVMSIRMMPMDYVFSRFPRVVRENALKLNKEIRLITKGQATELDKSLIERIIDPLTHLVRNSIDHGLETPEARVAKGKKPEGTLTLSAQHLGGQIVIEVSDDGAGLSRERILKKAISSGFPVSDSTPDEELWQLIFAPGFSTAEKVTEISGRGVGMDVVRRNIQDMGGHIQLSSRAGQGTTTRIFLPLTLAILDGMSVQVGEEIFVLPLSHVTESLQPSLEQVHSISQTEQVLHVRGEYLPLVALHDVFSVDNAQTDISKSIAVILQAEENRFALLVDHLVGQQQVVVKNLESNYRKIPGISAATILGDGSVALIVDVFALMRMTCSKGTQATAMKVLGEQNA